MKKTFSIIFIIFCIFVISCKKQDNKAKTLKTCIYSDIQTLDTRKASDYITSQVLFMLYRGLLHYNPNHELSLSLAKSYEVSKDEKVYKFYLKQTYWSDGTLITAYDFEKSWKKALDPAFPSSYSELFYPIKNAKQAKQGFLSLDEVAIKALDKFTLQVELENPNPHFLFLTSFFLFFPMPSHIKEQDINKAFVFSGPFKINKWHKNSEIILEKNPYFYNKDSINIDAIKINIVPNENIAFQMYENGEVNFISSFLSPLPIETLEKALKRKDIQSIPIAGFSFITFNTQKFPFNNKNLRKAFSLAINRKAIVKNITQLNEKVASRIIPEMLTDTKKNLIEDNNIPLANIYFEKALEELKLTKNDLKIVFSVGSYIIHKKEAQALKSMWEKAFGIKIELISFEDKIMQNLLFKRDYSIALGRVLSRYNDPIHILERYLYKTHPKNYPSWTSKNFYQILTKALKELDVKKRLKLIEQAEALLIEDMPITPLYFYNYLLFQKDYVKGIYANIVGDLLFDNTDLIKEKKL